MSNDTHYVIGQASAILHPDRTSDRRVDVARAHPGVIILVHGVNDIGVSYPAQEQGLCTGLNERLNRDDLVPGEYKLPRRDDKLVDDPDTVYYRRNAGDKCRSPVIPFYWGYRASREERAAKKKNGQYVDVHGNRLDKNFAVAGGMFANATSDIPSMFSGHYVRNAKVGTIETTGGDVYHPLRDAADRRYMILAAKRLAMMVAEIRKVDENETVTLVAHSQGCMLSLLAQAFLTEEGKRSADCLIMNHPPYSLHEQWMDRFMQDTDEIQESTHARLETLINLVKKITNTPHTQPPLADLANPAKGKGRAGPKWTPASCQRSDLSGKEQVFAERDNRGKVYLYFCPADQTVGLYNVQGIGTLGVPDQIDGMNANGVRKVFTPFSSLGPRFFQRVWTMRKRDNKQELVGTPPHVYTLVTRWEDDYPDAGFAANKARVSPDANETRTINGEALNPPYMPNLYCGESKGQKGKLDVDPIDASIAVANDGLGLGVTCIDDPTGPPRQGTLQELVLTPDEKAKVEAAINKGRKQEPDDWRTVQSAMRMENGTLSVSYKESPNDARLRHQSRGKMDNSYHSSIVGNPEHSRYVTAMDVAIGQATVLDDPGWRELFNFIADWRIELDKITPLSNYKRLSDNARKLIEANCAYYDQGTFPAWIMPKTFPDGVVSETRKQQLKARTQNLLQQQEEERRHHIDARNKDRQRAGLPPLPY